MVSTDRLHELLVSRGITQKELAKRLGMAESTLNRHMKRGVFYSGEMQAMVEILQIEDPAAIFFPSDVA